MAWDPELPGPRRGSLGPEHPRFHNDHGTFQPVVLLYPASLDLVWHVICGREGIALPVFDSVSDREPLQRPLRAREMEHRIEWEHPDTKQPPSRA